jgi:hypothetical protein
MGYPDRLRRSWLYVIQVARAVHLEVARVPTLKDVRVALDHETRARQHLADLDGELQADLARRAEETPMAEAQARDFYLRFKARELPRCFRAL